MATEMTGAGKIDGFQNDRLVFVTKRVAGVDALQTDAGANIAGIDVIDFFALIGMHLQQAADALARWLAGVVHVAAGFQNAGVDADVGDMADERVGHDFEGQRCKRLIVGSAPQNHFFGVGIRTFHRRNIDRRRQKINHRVEQRLNAFVLERRARQHRNDFQRQRRLADRLAHLFERERSFGQIFVEHFVVVLGDVFDDLLRCSS